MVMAPAHAGGRMGGCETTPPDLRAPGRTTQRPLPPASTTWQAFLACDHRPPLAGVKLVRPRPRPDGRYRCGRSSLTPDRAPARNTAPARKASDTVPASPTAQQVTGPIPYALLTKISPLGGCSVAAFARKDRHQTRARFGDL